MPVYEEQTVGGGSSMTMMLTFLIGILIIAVVLAVHPAHHVARVLTRRTGAVGEPNGLPPLTDKVSTLRGSR
jgi:hypothetical protein